MKNFIWIYVFVCVFRGLSDDDFANAMEFSIYTAYVYKNQYGIHFINLKHLPKTIFDESENIEANRSDGWLFSCCQSNFIADA